MSTRRKWTYEQLKGGATMLNLQTGTNRFDSQKGMTGIGMPRWNITKCRVKDVKEYIDIERKGNEHVRVQAGTNQYASQKGQTAMLAFRPNLPRIAYKEGWRAGAEKESETIVPCQAGSNQYASQAGGEIVIGKRRNQLALVRGRMPRDRRTELFIPFQSGTNMFASQSGMADPPAVGAYRQATTECEGLNFTEEMIRKSGVYPPWFNGSNKFASQRGSGGFWKYRDVLCKMVGGKEIPEELLLKCEGLVRLQSGTNKLASQKLMTSFGTPRNTCSRPKWKQEWVEEWQEAEQEFEASGRGRRHERDPITGALIVHKEEPKPQEPIAEEEE